MWSDKDAGRTMHPRTYMMRHIIRAPGIHLVVTDFVIANFASDDVFCHSLNLSKEVVSFTEVIYSVGKV